MKIVSVDTGYTMRLIRSVFLQKGRIHVYNMAVIGGQVPSGNKRPLVSYYVQG